jgi:hypothetical protein
MSFLKNHDIIIDVTAAITLNWSILKTQFVAIVNSQTEYWSREFQAQVILKDNSFEDVVLSLVSKGIVPVVQLDNDQSEFEFLKSLPTKSIIGWCYSDESLDTEFASRLSRLESLVVLLRPYHLNSFKVRNLFISLQYVTNNLVNTKTLSNALKLILWYFRGISMSYREQKIRKIYKSVNLGYVNFPLGYTDVFCSSLLTNSDIHVKSPSGSLLELTFHDRDEPKTHLVFVGQIGQIVRSVAIVAAQETSFARVITRSDYGAGSLLEKGVKEKGIEYLTTVLNSKFVLCPPGNISGNSFRIHETVILGKIPIVLSHIASDPNFITPFDLRAAQYSGQSWKKRIQETRQISEDLYGMQAQENLITLRSQIEESKEVIGEYLKHS